MPKHRTGYSKSERFVEVSIQNKSVRTRNYEREVLDNNIDHYIKR